VDLGGANNLADSVSHSGYNVMDNNCLSKAVEVFNAYSPSLSLDKGFVTVPITINLPKIGRYTYVQDIGVFPND
jgi:hypothetical protein